MGDYRNEAVRGFQTFCGMLDRLQWKYQADAQKPWIGVKVVGDDLPMDMQIHFDVNSGRFYILSKMPFQIAQEKRVETAIALNDFNSRRVLGVFDLDLGSGDLYYRISQCFVGCEIAESTCALLLDMSIKMVDRFNDKLLMLNKGVITLEQLLAEIHS